MTRPGQNRAAAEAANQGVRQCVRGGLPMFKAFVSAACGAAAMLALAAAPATAADELEAKLQACNACHGANGQPIDKSIPIIWGQTVAYMTKQLHDYRGEDRQN